MKIKRMKLRVVMIPVAVFIFSILIDFSNVKIGRMNTETVTKSTTWSPILVEAAESELTKGETTSTQPTFVLSPYEYIFQDKFYTQGEILNKFKEDNNPFANLLIYQNIQEEVDISEEPSSSIQSFSIDVSEDDELNTNDGMQNDIIIEEVIIDEPITKEEIVEEPVVEEVEEESMRVDEQDGIDCLVEIAANVIFSTETCAEYGSEILNKHYQAVNANDNGALSIGRLQWHANRAKELLQRIQQADPILFDEILKKHNAESLKDDVLGKKSWSHYRLRYKGYYYNAIKELLGTEVGKRVQDEVAFADVKEYITIGIVDYGITRPQSLIYFADIANQYGAYAKTVKMIIRRAKSQGATTLDNLYESTRWITTHYRDRRKSVYNIVNGMLNELPSITDYVEELNKE